MGRLNNILLVYPEIPNNTYWSFQYSLKFINKKTCLPPLGLITMAALLPEKYNLKLVDLNVEPLAGSDIEWADAVFISAMIIQQNSMNDIINACNQYGTPVVAGGPHPTSSHQAIDGVDHFVLGEAETIINEFLEDFENGTARHVYHAPCRPDLEDTPVPRFDLLKMDEYSSMAVQYSRGCPFQCEFCDIWVIYGRQPRVKSAPNIVKEINTLYRLGWDGSIFMVDDNFIGNKNRVKKELLPALIEWGKTNKHRFKFYTEASINLAEDEDLMNAMNTAGFDQVFIGIETPSEEGLKETGKSQNLKCDLREAVRTIQRHGMEVTAGFILGFDSDTEDIFDRQIEFIQQVGIPKAMVGMMQALPGTKLFERLEKEGRILSENLEGNNTHTMTTNFVPTMDEEKLKEGYKRVLDTLYDHNLKNYFARCDLLLGNLHHTGFKQRKLHWLDVRTLLKSLLFQSLTPYGWQYLKFLSRNLIRNPGLFAEVFTYAVMGHHFHMITQETLKVDRVASRLDDIYEKALAQVHRYSSSMKNASAPQRQKLSELWENYRKVLKKSESFINHIHVDFRRDLVDKYQDIYDRTRQLFAE
ncbi:MAG: radical SAM protein [Thermodesulfobacteriota bacterium]|nr:radical SAM protein [Thermodesulfobacteriota bacterium]